MSLQERKSDFDSDADVVAFDANDRPILVVEVKARSNAAAAGVAQLMRNLASSEARFGMFADLEHILIFSKDSADPLSPICSFRTADVLSLYEPQFGHKRIFHDYLRTLVEAWLRDFAFHWKSENPPGSGPMAAIHLSQKLAGGMTWDGRKLDESPRY